ncbi:hypothetical protein ASG98_19640 [Bacillus sp. Soil531]|nr:hypothetical protein ASG98_19640 [Bacillus sp. Soil531]
MDAITKLYLKALEPIGDEISKIANAFDKLAYDFTFESNEPKTLADVANIKSDFKMLLENFKAQQKLLKGLTPPSNLTNSHSKILASVEKFIDSTDLAIDSLNGNETGVDLAKFRQGIAGQRLASVEVVAISNEMVDTVVSNLNGK